MSETSFGLLDYQLKKAVDLHDALAEGRMGVPGMFKAHDVKAATVVKAIKAIKDDNVHGLTALTKEVSAADDKQQIVKHLEGFVNMYNTFHNAVQLAKTKPITQNVADGLHSSLETLRAHVSKYGLDELDHKIGGGYGGTTRVRSKLSGVVRGLETNPNIGMLKGTGITGAALAKEWVDATALKQREASTAAGHDNVSAVVGDLVDRLEHVIQQVEAQVSSSDPLDSTKITAEDFINYQSTSKMVQAKYFVDHDAIKLVKELEPIKLQNAIWAALSPQIDGCTREVDDKLKGTAATNENTDKRARLTALKTALQDLKSNLAMALGDAKPMASLPMVSNFQRAKQAVNDMHDEFRKQALTPNHGASLGRSSGDPAGGGLGSLGGLSRLGGIGGLLVRTPDVRRMRHYAESIKSFAEVVKDHKMSTQVTNFANVAIEAISSLSAGKAAGKPADPEDPVGRSMIGQTMTQSYSFIAGTKRALRSYIAMHANYVLRSNRDAFEYMRFWEANKEAGRRLTSDADGVKFDESLTAWKEKCKEIVESLAQPALKGVKESINGEAGVRPVAMRMIGESDTSRKLDLEFELLLHMAQLGGDKIARFYSAEYASPIDSLFDLPTLILYSLKALRLLCAWVALRVAAHVFEDMARRQVYVELKDPPNAAIFVGLFLAVDVSLGLVVLGFLGLTKYLFTDGDSDHPISGEFIMKWAVDYVAVTVLVAALALVIGAVIMRSRYFRFRYETSRGIRAMQSMVLSVYGVLLVVPFFRIVG